MGEKVETVTDFNFWAPKSMWIMTAATKKKQNWILKNGQNNK